MPQRMGFPLQKTQNIKTAQQLTGKNSRDVIPETPEEGLHGQEPARGKTFHSPLSKLWHQIKAGYQVHS